MKFADKLKHITVQKMEQNEKNENEEVLFLFEDLKYKCMKQANRGIDSYNIYFDNDIHKKYNLYYDSSKQIFIKLVQEAGLELNIYTYGMKISW